MNANEDESLADLQMSATLMISIVFPSLIIHEFDKDTYRPIVVKMGELVCKSLEVVRFESSCVINHIVVSGCHCSLTHRLTDKEEVEPEEIKTNILSFCGDKITSIITQLVILQYKYEYK